MTAGKGESVRLSRKVTRHWHYVENELYTQRLYLASPGGNYLAYALADTGALRIRDAKGKERTIARVNGRDVRFSADERYLATVRDAPGGEPEVIVVELATGDARRLGTAQQASWLEWAAGGVVVRHQAPHANGMQPALTYFPLEGEPRQLVASVDLAGRFVAARQGTRVMYFHDARAMLIDLARPDAAPELAGLLPLNSSVNNAEMTPDGSEAAIVTYDGVFRWKGNGLEKIDDHTSVHTVWYSPDGSQLAYASLDGATVIEGDRTYKLETNEYDLRALRFRQGASGLIVSINERAILWQPAEGTKKVLGKAPKGRTLEGADVFAGGTVLWTQQIKKMKSPSGQKRADNALPYLFAD